MMKQTLRLQKLREIATWERYWWQMVENQMNKMMTLIEADINDTDKVDLLEAEGEPENL